MAKKYSKEEREEALKLADEIGCAASSQAAWDQCGHAVRLAGTAEKTGGKAGAGDWRQERGRAFGGKRKTVSRTAAISTGCGNSSGGPWFFRQAPETVAKREKFRFIQAHAGRWPVAAMCRVLKVSQQGYYCYLRRPDKSQRDRQLLEQIYECIREEPENANYSVRRIIGWPRLHRNYTGGGRRIYRICKENNLMIRPKRRPNGITKEDRKAQKSQNLIKQNFSATKPNEKFLTDITEIPCSDGKLYLVAVLDCFDGSIQGFQTSGNMHAELAVAAFENACLKSGARGMILHSDRGSQFTSRKFRAVLKKYDALQSMSSAGRCYDNARMESFFATLKKEQFYQMDTAARTREEMRTIIYRYINYYNRRRITSVNGGLPPLVYRQQYLDAAASHSA